MAGELTGLIWTSDTERSAENPAPEMLLSVEPVLLTKAPREPSQEDPQPSTSSSHFCIGSAVTHGPMAAAVTPASGSFSLFMHGSQGAIYCV